MSLFQKGSSSTSNSNPVKIVKDKVINWWQRDVLGINDPPPIQRIVVTAVELAATIGIMYFFENGTEILEKLPSEHH